MLREPPRAVVVSDVAVVAADAVAARDDADGDGGA